MSRLSIDGDYKNVDKIICRKLWTEVGVYRSRSAGMEISIHRSVVIIAMCRKCLHTKYSHRFVLSHASRCLTWRCFVNVPIVMGSSNTDRCLHLCVIWPFTYQFDTLPLISRLTYLLLQTDFVHCTYFSSPWRVGVNNLILWIVISFY